MSALSAILAEPPLRRIVQAVLAKTPGRWRDKALYDAVDRPQYLVGCFAAADQARREGRDSVAVIEFGVAEGGGLLQLQEYADAVEQETGVRIVVYGFDTGGGMPVGTQDYRDHPDVWAPGDYKMDVEGLQAKLTARTKLVLGEIAETVLLPVIFMPLPEPIGFVAIDVDYYSSAADCLQILQRPCLRRVAMYFDDVMELYNHSAAGELLAIREFNDKHAGEITIDPWRGIRHRRPFPDAIWLDGMYMAHDLAAISRARLTRPAARMF